MRHKFIGLILLSSCWLLAQPTTAITLFGGGATYLGDLEPKDALPAFDIANLSVGLNASISLNYHWAIRAGGAYHFLEGNDQRQSNIPDLEKRNISFKTKLTEAAVYLVWTPFAHKRYPTIGGYKSIISPYLFVGGGGVFFNTDIHYGGPDGYLAARIQKDKDAKKPPAFEIPVGGGLDIDINKNMSLGLEFGLRKTYTDYLDGVSHAGKVNSDWFMSGGLTLTYRWHKPDYDRDGFLDDDDACPMGAGPDYTHGCPDSDGDRIPDSEDLCPYQVGKEYAQGCPDTDYDGIADFIDKCPDIPGQKSAGGCIDTDGDGWRDDEDMCPNCPATDGLSGCPDTDGDGVEDSRDRCPNMAGTLESGGCPFMDKDADGIPDKEDNCPDIKGSKQFNGCPDTDRDGLMDRQDKCPELAGTLSNDGCPEVTDDLKATLAMLTKAVQFETGSNQLTTISKEKLVELVELLKAYPYYHLGIAGYTDSRGKDSSNLRLSENRAKACADFLTEKGINTNRITHKGYGEAQPIATNDTTEGRKKNRRVTFELYVK